MAKDFISLKITGHKELQSRLERINGQLIIALKMGIMKSLIELEGEIKNKLSGKVLNVRTGTLRRSIGREISQSGNKIDGFVGSNLKYAAIHEFGGIIRAKNKPYLMFPINGGWVRTKQVKIPERSYLRSTLREQENNILGIVQREIEKLIEG